MPVNKPYRIRVKAVDGKPREPNKLKGQLVAHVDWIPVKDNVEFVVCAVKLHHLDQVRAKLAAAGLEEIPGGDTDLPSTTPQQANRYLHGGDRSADPQHQKWLPQRQEEEAVDLSRKPYGFVPLPQTFSRAAPVWHDSTCSERRLSGEIRFELENLTPLLVGWERRQIADREELWAPRFTWVDEAKGLVELVVGGDHLRTVATKSLLCPLRATWGERPVIIPGDSIKGLLRHELGALLGAPMERVAERSYSYRPNTLYPKDPNRRLIPRIARIPEDGVTLQRLSQEAESPIVRVPVALELLPVNLQYDRRHQLSHNFYRFVTHGGAPYRGGLGAGQRLNSKHKLYFQLLVETSGPTTRVTIPEEVQEGYRNTIRHLTDLSHGHFSERHPDVPNIVTGDTARQRLLEAAQKDVFQPGDLIWVEWDTEAERVVSFGWHYYYRWAYQDTVRFKGWKTPRMGLFPLEEEKGDKPQALSLVRRIFGYSGDNEGSKGIGRGDQDDQRDQKDHEQLMGRISVIAALEEVREGEREEERFLPPVFLKELGMPRPSAVEFYLKQPYYPNERPSDHATLVTYGDAAGYDTPGELAGRKFYLDRRDAYNGEPWKDDSEANRLNERSTIAVDASKPGRHFRFTLRFRDLDSDELASILLALCPNQFAEAVGSSHRDGYCSKLGYARPLGWGTVRITAKEMHFLEWQDGAPLLTPVTDLGQWFRDNFKEPPLLRVWLDIHRHQHPDAADYRRGRDGRIFSFHTQRRAEHTRRRRYEREERV